MGPALRPCRAPGGRCLCCCAFHGVSSGGGQLLPLLAAAAAAMAATALGTVVFPTATSVT
jgi:hypothetical protein